MEYPPPFSPTPATLAIRIRAEDHLGLVGKHAGRLCSRRVPYDDLFQSGVIGLLRAIERYDPSKGSFASFASPYIRGKILSEVKRQLRSEVTYLPAVTLDRLTSRQPLPSDDPLSEYLEGLPLPERAVLSLWLGLDGRKRNFREIGQHLGFSKQRANQLLHKSLYLVAKKLRKASVAA